MTKRGTVGDEMVMPNILKEGGNTTIKRIANTQRRGLQHSRGEHVTISTLIHFEKSRKKKKKNSPKEKFLKKRKGKEVSFEKIGRSGISNNLI
jgi:hypothetical protein